MDSILLIKLLGGLTAAAGIGTGSYLIKEHFTKSEEKSKESTEKPVVQPKSTTPKSGETPTTVPAKAPESPKNNLPSGPTASVTGSKGSVSTGSDASRSLPNPSPAAGEAAH